MMLAVIHQLFTNWSSIVIMAQVNIRQLFEDKQEQLALSWVAGAKALTEILDSELVNASNKGLIGHLNLIHPNWVQVLSEHRS